MAKRKPKELCLACERNELKEPEAHNSYSRYCDAFICSECGIKEAFEGFFWSIRAKAAGANIKPDLPRKVFRLGQALGEQ